MFGSRKKTNVFMTVILTLVLIFPIFTCVIGSAEGDLAAYYKFDGNLNDDSGNANNGTAVGDITFVPGVNGSAAQFNGESYIEVQPNSSLDLGKTMSFSVWLYKDFDSSQNIAPILVKTKDDVIHQDPYRVYDRLLKPVLEVGIPTGSELFKSNRLMDMHKWELLTVTYDGIDMKCYVNDKLTDVKSYSKDILISKGKLQIGMMFTSGKNWFYKGYMDDLRIYKKVLTNDEIKTLYNNVINGTGKDIVIKPKQQMAYFKFNGDLNDSSGHKNNAVLVGTEKYAPAVQGKGFVFDGATYLEVPDSDSLEADTGLTLSTWMLINTKNIPGVDWPLLDRQQVSIQPRQSAFTYYTRIFGGGKSGTLCTYLINDGNTSPVGHQTKPIESQISQWCMLTVTFDDATKTLTYYLNGTQIDVHNDKFLSLRHSGGKLIIGLMNKNRFFNGTMDEIRLYNYPMSTAEVKALYNYKDTLKIDNAAAQLSALKLKGTLQLKVLAVSPAAGEAPLDVTASVGYSSSNQKVVTVSATGKVTAVGKGKAAITITNGVSTTTANVVVK